MPPVTVHESGSTDNDPTRGHHTTDAREPPGEGAHVAAKMPAAEGAAASGPAHGVAGSAAASSTATMPSVGADVNAADARAPSEGAATGHAAACCESDIAAADYSPYTSSAASRDFGAMSARTSSSAEDDASRARAAADALAAAAPGTPSPGTVPADVVIEGDVLSAADVAFEGAGDSADASDADMADAGMSGARADGLAEPSRMAERSSDGAGKAVSFASTTAHRVRSRASGSGSTPAGSSSPGRGLASGSVSTFGMSGEGPPSPPPTPPSPGGNKAPAPSSAGNSGSSLHAPIPPSHYGPGTPAAHTGTPIPGTYPGANPMGSPYYLMLPPVAPQSSPMGMPPMPPPFPMGMQPYPQPGYFMMPPGPYPIPGQPVPPGTAPPFNGGFQSNLSQGGTTQPNQGGTAQPDPPQPNPTQPNPAQSGSNQGGSAQTNGKQSVSSGGSSSSEDGVRGGATASVKIGNDQFAMLAAAIASGVAAHSTVEKVPKGLRALPNHGHVFTWASNSVAHGTLRRYNVTLTGLQQAALMPANAMAFEKATDDVKPEALLRGFLGLSITNSNAAATIDYADAHRIVLVKLVTAVLALDPIATANSQAARYLWNAMQYNASKPLTVAQVHLFKRAWELASPNAECPSDPTPLLTALAKAFVPLLGGGDRDYREHLIKSCSFEDHRSIPSSVLLTAARVANSRYVDTAAEDEAKELFEDWVHYQMTHASERHRELLQPVRNLFDDMAFNCASRTQEQWLWQLQMMEREGSSLYPLVSSLRQASPQTSMPRIIGKTRPAQPVISEFELGADDPPTETQAMAPASAPPVYQLPDPRAFAAALASHMPKAKQQSIDINALSASLAQSLGGGSASAIADAVMQRLASTGTPLVQMLPQRHETTPASAVTRVPPLKDSFVPPGYERINALSAPIDAGPSPKKQRVNRPGSVGGVPTPDPAFAKGTGNMDRAWAEQYGCVDFVLPNAPAGERFLMNMALVCAECDLIVPDAHRDEPYIGGAACPFCLWVGLNQGFEFEWYFHPLDPAAPPNQAQKPPGRNKSYVHQVGKCRNGLALVHRLVRLDRDAGRGDARIALFTPRPGPPRQFQARGTTQPQA